MDNLGIKCVRVLVAGRVQGVHFRESTRREAQRLGVHGWVRNLPDGRVEAQLSGTEGAVDELLAWMRQGPEHARVAGVDVQPAGDDAEPGFRVLR